MNERLYFYIVSKFRKHHPRIKLGQKQRESMRRNAAIVQFDRNQVVFVLLYEDGHCKILLG